MAEAGKETQDQQLRHPAAGHGGGASGGGHGGGHGGSHGPPQHEEHEEHEGAPEWLISFADNTALMMGFFVILLALNMAPKGGGAPGPDGKSQPTAEQLDWAIGVRAGFNNPVRVDSKDPRDQAMIHRILERKAQGEGIEQGPKGQGQRVQSIRPNDYHALSGAVAFEDSSATLNEDARATLTDLATRIRGLRLVVEVRGHASAAEAFNQPDKAMRLSFDRAIVVTNALTAEGVDWRQIRVIACGDNERLRAVAYAPDQQRQNQRVEVIVTEELLAPAPAPADTPPASENK